MAEMAVPRASAHEPAWFEARWAVERANHISTVSVQITDEARAELQEIVATGPLSSAEHIALIGGLVTRDRDRCFTIRGTRDRFSSDSDKLIGILRVGDADTYDGPLPGISACVVECGRTRELRVRVISKTRGPTKELVMLSLGPSGSDAVPSGEPAAVRVPARVTFEDDVIRIDDAALFDLTAVRAELNRALLSPVLRSHRVFRILGTPSVGGHPARVRELLPVGVPSRFESLGVLEAHRGRKPPAPLTERSPESTLHLEVTTAPHDDRVAILLARVVRSTEDTADVEPQRLVELHRYDDLELEDRVCRIWRCAAARFDEQVMRYRDREVAGFLYGLRDPARGRVEIYDVALLSIGFHNTVRLTTHHRERARDAARPSVEVVGWWHTHVDRMGILMSEPDRQVHFQLFPRSGAGSGALLDLSIVAHAHPDRDRTEVRLGAFLPVFEHGSCTIGSRLASARTGRVEVDWSLELVDRSVRPRGSTYDATAAAEGVSVLESVAYDHAKLGTELDVEEEESAAPPSLSMRKWVPALVAVCLLVVAGIPISRHFAKPPTLPAYVELGLVPSAIAARPSICDDACLRPGETRARTVPEGLWPTDPAALAGLANFQPAQRFQRGVVVPAGAEAEVALRQLRSYCETAAPSEIGLGVRLTKSYLRSLRDAHWVTHWAKADANALFRKIILERFHTLACADSKPCACTARISSAPDVASDKSDEDGLHTFSAKEGWEEVVFRVELISTQSKRANHE